MRKVVSYYIWFYLQILNQSLLVICIEMPYIDRIVVTETQNHIFGRIWIILNALNEFVSFQPFAIVYFFPSDPPCSIIWILCNDGYN